MPSEFVELRPIAFRLLYDSRETPGWG